MIVERLKRYLLEVEVARRAAKTVLRWTVGEFGDYLRGCRGVIHVGANEGQERDFYAGLRLRVLWIEPIPDVYDRLAKNIARYKDQVALKALISDCDDVMFTLNVSNNSGASSSVFDLYLHKDIFPDVFYVGQLQLPSITLPTLLDKHKINVTEYDALVLDTQGSEQLVLKGAETLLSRFKFIQAEAADFESYKGGATTEEIARFLLARNFELFRSKKFARHELGGWYSDLVFRRN